jgi:hypothetical protein
METDNTTATGYNNGKIKQKRTKDIDMRYCWIKDRVKQGKLKKIQAQVLKIWRIISQNTIHWHITDEYKTYTYTPTNDR